MNTSAAATSAIFFFLFFFAAPVAAWRPWPRLVANITGAGALIGDSKKYEGSSEFVDLKYHNGPIMTDNITVHIIWYGTWQNPQKKIIREFISSISASGVKGPSVAGWWRIVRTYTDKARKNISGTVLLGQEKNDRFYSHGKRLTRLSVLNIFLNY